MNAACKTENRPVRKLSQRLGPWVSALRFAFARGGSPMEMVKLFYHTRLKLSFVFRGWKSFTPEKILSFQVQTLNRRKFKIYARDNGLDVGTIAEFFMPHCKFESSHQSRFKPKVIYDMGANIGVASLYFASLYPHARFYGFEPMPANYEVCSLNYQNLERSRSFPWAVGSRSEMTTFNCLNDPRGGRLQDCPADPNLQLTGKIDVQVVSVSDLIQIHKLEPPDYLKIDVEGAEMEVLQGIGEYIDGINQMFVETHGLEIHQRCLEWLKKHGFKILDSSDPTAIWAERAQS